MGVSTLRNLQMAVAFLFLCLNLALAAPSTLDVRNLNATAIADIPSNPSTVLSITDRNGADVASSFRVMVYSGSPPTNANKTGLEDRQLRGPTYINNCPFQDSFKESKCDVWRNPIGSLQAWTKTCQKFVTIRNEEGIPYGSRFEKYYRNGHCAIDEICVNSFGPEVQGQPGPQIATCIARSEFGPTFDKHKSGLKRILDAVLDSIRGPGSPPKQAKIDSSESGGESGRGSSAAIVISKADGQTPIEAKSLGLSVWNEANRENGGAAKQHDEKCRMCSDLEMAKVGSDSDHMELEARLLTAGTVAGVLWVAVMSG